MNRQIREGYAKFLQEYDWDYFGTITFRSARRDPVPAIKHVYKELKKSGVKRAFIGAEPFKTGDLHLHGIMQGTGLPGIETPKEVWKRCFDRFGRTKIEYIKSKEDVANYCAKYVLKAQNNVSDHYQFCGKAYQWRKKKSIA